jgi:hypothetical protein
VKLARGAGGGEARLALTPDTNSRCGSRALAWPGHTRAVLVRLTDG